MYSRSVSDLNILKQEMSDTKATWKEWLTASHRCRSVMPGKSYAEVLKIDLQSKFMQSYAKNRVATQQGCLEGKLSGWGNVAPLKNQKISSDSPAC